MMAGGGIGNVLDYPEPREVWAVEPPTCGLCGVELESDGDRVEPMLIDCECEVVR